MKKPKVLFISQEITPYLEETPLSLLTRKLPQGIQERGKEIRVFMPKYGCINERRNQLHEVIRLSGMNLIIDESDHPLIIKVASIQSARMQVYFIDNEEYFNRKTMLHDKKEVFCPDNDERAIFFCRGVLETVKKLGWAPDIVHCHGWLTSLVPLYLRKAFKEDPIFANSKIVYSVYDNEFDGCLSMDYAKKLKIEGISDQDVHMLKTPNFVNINKSAIAMADAVIIGSEKINTDIEEFIKETNKPMLAFHPAETYIDAYSTFYDEVLEMEPALAEE
ncbi:MAG: glycogen/starch synthase [Bacteroidetes bacterium]|nr:glycogen/starch synthase [Bacteroidota bacterium]HET6245413.1 glycogen/starch synthase [Bacteroidia bacterium]